VTAPTAVRAQAHELPGNMRRTLHHRAQAATLMTTHGTTWAAVKTWATHQTDGHGRARWMPADLTRPINPAVVAAWGRAHGHRIPWE
jgi:hypothetical protein